MKRHLSRNDLCSCLSGKKYKKCCLPKYEKEENEILNRANNAVNNGVGEVRGRATTAQVAFERSNRWQRPKAKKF